MSVKDTLRRWLDWIVEPEHVPPPGKHRLGRPPEPPRRMTDEEIDAWARAYAAERGWETYQ